MTSSMRWLFAFACLVALGLGVALALNGSKRPAGDAAAPGHQDTIATVFGTPRALPDVTLVDASGAALRSGDLAGQRSWLFFGFASCPDVCPATLSIIANALEQLPEDERPQVYMVSVDPERDTPDRLGPYVTHFDPDFNALTGELPEITRLADALYATFAKVPLEGDNYTMDHFAGIFFLNERADVVAVSTTPHRPDQLAADYRAIHAL